MWKTRLVFFVCFWAGCFCYTIIDDNSTTPTDIFEYVLLNETRHPCTRVCVKNGPPMICRYHFAVEWYRTLSKACYRCPHNPKDCFRPHCIPGDGNKRPVLVVNRQMPGPAVEVCVGDEVVVDVENLLLGEGTTIHWHGHHQKETPYMDGVPMISQCPVQPGTTFRYHFKAVHPGTHFWHSHLGMQRVDGIFGSFVVKVPEEDDPHSHLYDYDLSSHVMLILDWGPELASDKFVAHHHAEGDNKPENLLVNGHGRFMEFSAEDNATIYTPTARFVVERGYRYRFRVINAGFQNCPIEISVDNHTVTAVSSDGNDFSPVDAESIVIYAGERFDFVLKADQAQALYWIRFRGLVDCDERFKRAHQAAVLQYKGESDADFPEGDPDYESARREGLQINAVNRGPGENDTVNIVELKSLDKWDDSLKEVPDYKFFVSYDFYTIDNPHFHQPDLYGYKDVKKEHQLKTPQLNFISLKLQPQPLLPSRDDIDSSNFCNSSTAKNCTKEFCECTHVLQVPLNSVVELIIIDKGFAFNANHPFHLHGHSFRAVGMHKAGDNVTEEEVRRMDAEGLIQRNLKDPPVKDTVTIPDGGFTVLRFTADNPGYWLLHCHIEFHMEIGMALVFKVGENDQMKPVPRHFPTCGDYLPDYHYDGQSECGDKNLAEKIKNWIDGNECSSGVTNQKLEILGLFSVILFLLIR